MKTSISSILASVLMTFVAGCSSGNSTDAAVGMDLSIPGDASPDGGGVACTSVTGGKTKELVINTITLPTPLGATAFQYDLDGDGKPENRYAKIVSSFQSQGLSAQPAGQATVVSGNNLMLVRVTSSDPTFQNDSCAGSELYKAESQPSPNFSGTGSFAIDNSVPPGPFKGALASAMFDSNTPATTSSPVSVQVMLDFAGAMVRVPLIGAHLQWTYGSGLTSGQLNGAIRNTDIQNTVIPAIATSFNAAIRSNPTSSRSTQLLGLFDKGGTPDPSCSGACKSPDGTCAISGNRIIEACEVGTNDLIKGLLGPDVQMYSDDGTTYMPNPGGYPAGSLPDLAGVDMSGTLSKKDSLSVGIGFTAVGTSF